MNKSDNHPKLSHLTEQQISDLMNRYYLDDEKVEDLLTAFSISTSPSNLVKLFPPNIHDDILCPYCHVSMTSSRVSRSYYSTAAKPHCPQCKHLSAPNCHCSQCREVEKQSKEQIMSIKREIIEANYGSGLPTPSLSDLSGKDALLLLTTSRHSLSEDLETLEPFQVISPKFSPMYELTNECIRHLYRRGYISISPQSNLDAFVYDDDLTDTTAYYPTLVTWRFLPGLSLDDKRNILQTLEEVADTGEYAAEWNDDFDELWRTTAKFECLEYYDYQLKKRNFEIENFGDKTHATFETLLGQFSIGQVFNLVWQAVRDTNDYISSESIPRYRGKNMFVGAVQRKGDKAKAEGWEIRNSRRDFNCQQSVLSATLFDRFLGIGQEYLEKQAPKLR